MGVQYEKKTFTFFYIFHLNESVSTALDYLIMMDLRMKLEIYSKRKLEKVTDTQNSLSTLQNKEWTKWKG